MVDRVPLYPGRVKMTPVSGQANIYDMERADQPTQAGTPLNKTTLLKDSTAALYGLTDATPDDVFECIGKYNIYWWKKWIPSHAGIAEVRTNISSETKVLERHARTIQYSYELNINQSTGEYSLKNPINLEISSTTSSSTAVVAEAQKIVDHAPCYITNLESDPSAIYYVPQGATAGNLGTDATIFGHIYGKDSEYAYIAFQTSATIKAQWVTTQSGIIPPSDPIYLQSTNRNAYPDGGTQDGYEYKYLGTPFENAATAAKVATVSYTGVGTYGENSRCALTFDFAPVWVFLMTWYISGDSRFDKSQMAGDFLASSNTCSLYMPCVPTTDSQYIGFGGTSASSDNLYGKKSEDGKTITWYSTSSASEQCNTQGYTYCFVAIG